MRTTPLVLLPVVAGRRQYALVEALRSLAPVLGPSGDAAAVRTALHAVALQRAVGPGADAPGAERALRDALDRLALDESR
jgi:hypothetical protein